MRRPLSVAALCLVIIAAIRLGAGWAAETPPGYVSTGQLGEYDTLTVTGRVYQKDDTSIYLKSVIIVESNALGQSAVNSRQYIPCIENLICETEAASGIPLGSTVALEGVFYSYSKASNPGEFDASVYYRTLEIGGRLRKAQVLARGEDYWPVRDWLYRLRCQLKDRLYRIFPEKEASVMSALLLGDKSDLDSELKDLYKRNGILHILSISSLHITILGMSVYKLLRKMGMPTCPAAVAGSVLLLLYGCMTGFSVSVCRAVGMYLIKMLAEIAGRTYDMLTALAVLAAVMVIRNPYYLMNSGFLLSFASVLGIGIVYPALLPKIPRGGSAEEKDKRLTEAAERLPAVFRNPCKEVVNRIQGVPAGLCQSAFASLSITLTTLPVQLWFYYEIPVYSVFLNLLVLPFMKPMIITGLLALIVPGLGMAGIFDRLVLGGYEFLCKCFDRLPFPIWNPGCPRLWQIVIYYLMLTAMVILRNHRREGGQESDWKKVALKPDGQRGNDGQRQNDRQRENDRKIAKKGKSRGKNLVLKAIGRRIHARGVTDVMALCVAVLLFAIRPFSHNSVTFLDIGQGDCILLRTVSGQTYLFDCGSSSRSSVGKYVLLPYLKYCGIHEIDAIFLSHPDADHINGALELLEINEENHIKIGQLLLPAVDTAAREEVFREMLTTLVGNGGREKVPVGYLAVGDQWQSGDTVFLCLHPPEGFSTKEPNAYSECFLVRFYADSGQESTLLLTGDVQEEGEKALMKELKERGIGNLTVLKAAHHGSRNSTPTEFLEQLRPLVTVISSGRNNRYGHPHAELMERLEQSGTYILQTAQSGAVTISFRRGRTEVKLMWEKN